MEPARLGRKTPKTCLLCRISPTRTYSRKLQSSSTKAAPERRAKRFEPADPCWSCPMAGTNPIMLIESSEWEPAFIFPGAGTPSRPQPPHSGGSWIIRDLLQPAPNWPHTYRVKTRSDQHMTPLSRYSCATPVMLNRAELLRKPVYISGRAAQSNCGRARFTSSRIMLGRWRILSPGWSMPAIWRRQRTKPTKQRSVRPIERSTAAIRPAKSLPASAPGPDVAACGWPWPPPAARARASP